MSILFTKVTTVVETPHTGIYVVRKDTNDLYFVEASIDECPENPRAEYEHFTEICIVGNRCPVAGDKTFSDSGELNGYLENLRESGTEFILYRLYVLDHSGVSISLVPFNDSWDSWCCGCVICKRKDAEKFYGKLNDDEWGNKARELVNSDVSEYDSYINGNVYTYTLYKYNKNDGEWYEDESCCGFYSDADEDLLCGFFSKETARIVSDYDADNITSAFLK